MPQPFMDVFMERFERILTYIVTCSPLPPLMFHGDVLSLLNYFAPSLRFLRVSSRRNLWSSSAMTAGSCFFLCFDIVCVVIEPILSNATCRI